MPIYEYICQACGHAHEALQKMTDQLLVDCPECKQPQLKKKISAVGFKLKGTGWYETDFKGGSAKKSAEDRNAGDSKTDTKPASKSSDSSSTHTHSGNCCSKPSSGNSQ